jgi:NADH-quinone oxidoreductase subunit N
MSIENFLIMRHELLLTAAVLLVLMAEIFTDPRHHGKISLFSVLIFAIVTLAGFISSPEGTLFGGMYDADGTRLLMKNILNIGVLIVLIQSMDWLKKEENAGKISEYFILLLSAVAGMSFMISSGHFLMFYIGLELATIPVTALAAFERYRNRSAEAGIKLILASSLSSGISCFTGCR